MSRSYEERGSVLEYAQCYACGRKHNSCEGFVIDLHNRAVIGCTTCLATLQSNQRMDFSCPNCDETVSDDEYMYIYETNDKVLGCEYCIHISDESDEDMLPTSMLHFSSYREFVFA